MNSPSPGKRGTNLEQLKLGIRVGQKLFFFFLPHFPWPFSVTFNLENVLGAAAWSAEIENVVLSHTQN